MKMDIHAVFPSNYLKAEDLGGKRHKMKIAKVALEDIGGDGDERTKKPVLYFQGAKKGLVLNKTNAYVLADAFRTDTDGWVGQWVELYPTKVGFQGRLVAAIRLDAVSTSTKPAEATLPAQAVEKPNASVADDLNDSIPF